LVRSYILTEKQRKAIKVYIEELPERMPSIIKQIRHTLSKINLEEMESDIDLLKTMENLKVVIGRSKHEGWLDQKGVFVVRPKTASEEK